METSSAAVIIECSPPSHDELSDLDDNDDDNDDNDVFRQLDQYDPDDADEDKENVSHGAIFGFGPQTPSVLKMEHIFAEQCQPTFRRPMGYISPLRCPRYPSKS